jgi:hypothetical protein
MNSKRPACDIDFSVHLESSVLVMLARSHLRVPVRLRHESMNMLYRTAPQPKLRGENMSLRWVYTSTCQVAKEQGRDSTIYIKPIKFYDFEFCLSPSFG